MTDLPVDLRTLVTIKAWEDAKFASDLKKDPGKAVSTLAASLGLDIGTAEFEVVTETKGKYTLVIADNPMGAAPAEMRQANIASKAGGGVINTFTADCGCSDTYTGGCPCKTVFGTPCLTCVTAVLC